MDVKDMIIYLLSPMAQIGVIIGLAEVGKQIGLPKKWIPLFDLILGIGIGILIYGYAQGLGLINGLVLGTALGLSACGLFSGIKNFRD